MFYIISTPIGNLGDITYRAVEILKSCNALFCEDTRTSRVLMERYGIETPLFSYHKFNEKESLSGILRRLKEGETVALISDAGTPLISDPGGELIKALIEEKLPFTALPGPAALIDAVVLSGLPSERFQFIGFLPKTANDLAKELHKALSYEGTTIAYESPHRIRETLILLQKAAPTRLLVIARELTKKFEELIRGTAEELLSRLREEPKGEFVLLISPSPELDFTHLSPKEHVTSLMEDFGIDEKAALRIAAELRGVQKRSLYKEIKNF